MTPAEFFKSITAEAHADAVAHGWYDNGPRSWFELMALVNTELAEATEALRRGNPPDEHCPQYRSYMIEMADVIIRMADAVGAYYHGMATDVYTLCAWELVEYCPVPILDSRIDEMAILHRRVPLDPGGVSWFVVDVFEVVADSGLLRRAVRAKMNYNKTRPYRHGGKVL